MDFYTKTGHIVLLNKKYYLVESVNPPGTIDHKHSGAPLDHYVYELYRSKKDQCLCAGSATDLFNNDLTLKHNAFRLKRFIIKYHNIQRQNLIIKSIIERRTNVRLY